MERMMNEDVLMEIFLRLPPKSVCRLKCVSRRWNEIVSGCFFRDRHIKYSSGLVGLILTEKRYNRSLPRTRVADDASSTTNIPKQCGRFIHFCSSSDGSGALGLALFVYEPSNHPINWGPGRRSKPPPTYHVVNVSTKTWVPVPLPPWSKTKLDCSSTALVCNNTNNFKIVRVIRQPTMFVEIYSSITGMWTRSHPYMITIQGCKYFQRFGPPLVLNGLIHWSVSTDAIGMYLLRENLFFLMEKPVDDETLCSSAFTRPTLRQVWYGGITWQRQIKIWTTDLSFTTPPWSLLHTMNFDDSLISSDHSILTSYQRECIKDYNGFYIIGFSPWNPHIVLFLIRGAIFLYSMDNGLMERLHYGGPRIIDPIGIHPCFNFSHF